MSDKMDWTREASPPKWGGRGWSFQPTSLFWPDLPSPPNWYVFIYFYFFKLKIPTKMGWTRLEFSTYHPVSTRPA